MSEPMPPMSYTPKAKNRSATALILILTLAAVICFLMSAALSLYRGMVQLLALLLAVSAIFVAVKYVLVTHTYSVFPGQGDVPPCFLVEQAQGRRTSLVCRIPLRGILSVEPYKGGSYSGRCYIYTATMRGGAYQILRAREAGHEFCVKLEADEDFMRLLLQKIAEAKATQTE